MQPPLPPGDAGDADPGIEEPGTQDPARRSRRSVLLRGTLWQAVGQLAPLVVNVALTPYVVAGLGKQRYAVFLLVAVIQSFMQTVDGGIGPSANRWFTLYAGRGDRVATTRLLTTLGLLVAAVTVVVFGVFFAAAPAIVAWFPATRVDPYGAVFFLRTMIVLVAINQVRGLFSYVLFAHHRFAVTTTMLLVGYVVYVAGMIWSIETGRGLVGIAAMFVVQQSVATLAIVPSACRFLAREGIGLLTRAELREFFGYAWKAQLSSVLDVTAQYGDMVVVQRFRAVDAAAFGPGSTFAQQLRSVPMNAFSPIQSVVGGAVGAHGELGARPVFERVQRTWVVAVAGWVAVGAPASYFGVTAWLHRGLGGSPLPGLVAAILLVGSFFSLLVTIQVVWVLSVGRSDLELRYGLVALVLNLAGTLALIRPFGVVGSVTATAVSQGLAAVFMSAQMRRSLQVVPTSPLRLVPWAPVVVGAALSFAGTWAAARLVGGVVPYGALGLLTCGLGAAPALVVYALWALGPRQVRELLAARVPGLRR